MPGDAEKQRQAQMAAMKKMMAAQGAMMPGMEHVFSQMEGFDQAPMDEPKQQVREDYGFASHEAYTAHAHQPASDEPQMWEVVGGGDKGGIIVRIGRDLASPQEKKRLSTGALLREEELVGDRLRYTRLSGTGPLEGWVSLTVSGTGKPLVMRVTVEEEAPPAYQPPVHQAPVHRKDATAAAQRKTDGYAGAQSYGAEEHFAPPPREKLPRAGATADRAPAVPQEAIHVPDLEDVLKHIDQDAEEEVQVPDIDEVLRQIERDAREEEELNTAEAARESFFHLSIPSTVAVKQKQWWEEAPDLRLDGPKFNFQTVGLLGRHAYADSTGQPVQPPERTAPKGEWFRSSSSLSDRLLKNANAEAKKAEASE